MYVVMFISKRCSIIQSDGTCAPSPTVVSHGGSRKEEGTTEESKRTAGQRTTTKKKSQLRPPKEYMPKLAKKQNKPSAGRKRNRDEEGLWVGSKRTPDEK